MHPFGFSPVIEGEIIVAAALIALVGIIVSPRVVWAAIIGVLLILQQSVARIEKRLDAMENR
jgi:type III secretory pathway component EscS